MGHMHPRDVNRTASIINHPAWKASDCKLSGVTIRFEFWQLTEPAICNRLGKAGATFPTPIEDNKTRRIWRSRKTRRTSCVSLRLSHLSYNCIFFAGRRSGGPISYSVHQLVSHILKAEVTVDLQIIS